MRNLGTSINEVCIWLLASLYIVLPTYFSLEVTNFLPSFTGSRLVFLFCLFLIVFIKKKLTIPRSQYIKTIYFFVFIITLVNVLHLSDSSSYSIKAIFSLLLENILLVFVIVSIVKDRHQIEKFISIMVLTSIVVTLFAIIEFLTGYNVFYWLTTTSRTVYQASYIRLGMMRAEASFGHSVYFGVYCSCMLPFSLYLYENTPKIKYLIAAIFNIIGTLISGSRGQMVACFTIILIMFLKKKNVLKKKYIILSIVGIFFVVIGILFVPAAFSYVSENIKSILNIIGFNFEISPDYGINVTGIDSRIVQISGIRWLVQQGAILLGLGSLAPSRGLVSYYWISTGWQRVISIDVGYVGWLLEYGIVGAIGYIVLFLKFFISSIKKSNNNDTTNLYNPFKWFFLCYLLNLLSSTGLEKMLWVVIALVVSYDRMQNNLHKRLLK